MIAITIILAIFVLLLFIPMKTKRLRITVLTGYVVSLLSLFISFILLFSLQREILFALLCVSYLSIIAFLVLWNLQKPKSIFLLCIPAMCIVAGIGIFIYQGVIRKIPTVDEPSYLYRYFPFTENNSLVKLDEKSNLTITGNLPFLDGATALYPVYASFAEAVYPENEYKTAKNLVLCSTTDGAYDNLLEGKVDIIFCAGPSDLQIQQFNDRGIKLRFIPIGQEAFVFFVHINNTVNNVTIENIQGIYSGKITNWKELNGANKRIRAFQRPQYSGSQTLLEKVMGNIPIIDPRRENLSGGMGDIINQVAVYRNFPDAIGYSFLFFATEMVKNDQIKLLSIGGIYPSKETILDGSYPFSDSFYAIFADTNEKNENIDLFIEWILSDQGQTLILKTGYIPINPQM